MASLKKIASILREDAQDGIAWFVLWKKGRSWKALEVWPEADQESGEAQPENEQIQELASGSAYLLLQAIDSLYSVEYRVGLLGKAAKMVTDLRDALVREMAGLDGYGGAPPRLTS